MRDISLDRNDDRDESVIVNFSYELVKFILVLGQVVKSSLLVVMLMMLANLSIDLIAFILNRF